MGLGLDLGLGLQFGPGLLSHVISTPSTLGHLSLSNCYLVIALGHNKNSGQAIISNYFLPSLQFCAVV